MIHFRVHSFLLRFSLATCVFPFQFLPAHFFLPISQICAFHSGLFEEATPPKPGTKAERALSTEVLLNLCAAISHKKYASNIMEDFYSMLKVSSSIRDGFIGPFLPFPENISEKLITYNKKRNISDVMRIFDEYTEHTNEISEFVSLKMSAALPFTYDRFVVFIAWRPTRNMSIEPVDELAKIVESVYQSIIKPNGIYEHSKHLFDVLTKPFNEAARLKNKTLETINHLFEAIDHNNEKQYHELKNILQEQLTKLDKTIHVSIQTLRRLKIKDILLKLSTVHRRFYRTALEIFRDEFKPLQVKNQLQNGSSENVLADSLWQKMETPFERIEQSYERYSNHSLLVLFLYLILFIFLFLWIFARFRRNLYFFIKMFPCFYPSEKKIVILTQIGEEK